MIIVKRFLQHLGSNRAWVFAVTLVHLLVLVTCNTLDNSRKSKCNQPRELASWNAKDGVVESCHCARLNIPEVTSKDKQRLRRRLLARDANPSSTVVGTNDNDIIPAAERAASEMEQQRALHHFYNASRMWMPESSKRHDWFDAKHKLDEDRYDFCNFQGVDCRELVDKDKTQNKKKSDSNQWDKESVIVGIDLQEKGLSGSLPHNVFASLTHLESLDLGSNAIVGVIPNALLEHGQLRNLDLSRNQFSGHFPAYNSSVMPKFRRVLLQYNNLEGVLPGSLCLFAHLNALDISGNVNMHGTIPACLGQLPELEVFKLDDVGLSGSIPSELCTRRMNGFDPEDNVGCDVIACPVGTFEPSFGRYRENSPCLPCPLWVSNNDNEQHLGSKECPDVDTAFSPQPSGVPSFSPSLFPTLRPSSSPTQNTSRPTESPSLAPFSPGNPTKDSTAIWMSSSPTAFPSRYVLTEAPSYDSSETAETYPPTEAETTMVSSALVANHTLHIQMVISGINRQLEKPSEVQIMEQVILEFLQHIDVQKKQDEFVAVYSVSMTMQTLERIPISALSNTIPTPSLKQVGSASSHDHRNRQVPVDEEIIVTHFVMDLEVVLVLSPSLVGTIKSELVRAWDEAMDSLVVQIQQNPDLSGIFESPKDDDDSDGIVRSSSGFHGSGTSTGIKVAGRSPASWHIMYTALILACVALVSASTVLITRWWNQYAGPMGYKRHENSGASLGEDSSVNSNSSDASTTPPTNANNKSSNVRAEEKGQNGSDPDDFFDNIDTLSAFSCWKNWDVVDGVVSEESEGGWNSSNGSGSVADSYLHGEPATSKYDGPNALLANSNYSQDDVWSLPPDQRLCFSSGSGGSGENDDPDDGHQSTHAKYSEG